MSSTSIALALSFIVDYSAFLLPVYHYLVMVTIRSMYHQFNSNYRQLVADFPTCAA